MAFLLLHNYTDFIVDFKAFLAKTILFFKSV